MTDRSLTDLCFADDITPLTHKKEYKLKQLIKYAGPNKPPEGKIQAFYTVSQNRVNTINKS